MQQNLAKPARQDAARAELRRERGERVRQRTSVRVAQQTQEVADEKM
jgi:predicted house-cleaning NTP pyrophosphatase (Maf/HAM1 superfamily)